MLAAEATPPSFHVVMMLAHMPLFRAEHHRRDGRAVRALHAAIAAPGSDPARAWEARAAEPGARRPAAAPQRGRRRRRLLALLARADGTAGIPAAQRELVQAVRAVPRGSRPEGVWHPHKGMDIVPRSTNPYAWPTYPLEPARGRGALERLHLPSRAHRATRRPPHRDRLTTPQHERVPRRGGSRSTRSFPRACGAYATSTPRLGGRGGATGRNRGRPDAPPVLLVHGWGASIYMWRDWFARLAAAGYRVVALDLPGHGLSDKPSEEGRYRLASRRRTVREVIAIARLRRPHVVAQSMGGTIALELAVRPRSRHRTTRADQPGVLRPRVPRSLPSRAAREPEGRRSDGWRDSSAALGWVVERARRRVYGDNRVDHGGRHRSVLGTVAVPRADAGDATAAARVHVGPSDSVGDGAAAARAQQPPTSPRARRSRYARPAGSRGATTRRRCARRARRSRSTRPSAAGHAVNEERPGEVLARDGVPPAQLYGPRARDASLPSRRAGSGRRQPARG